MTSRQASPATGLPHSRRRSAAALLVVLGAVLALLLGGAGTASAHAALISTDPGQDAVVATAPSRIVLTFSEGVTLSDDSLQVYDPAGKQVEQGPPGHVDGKGSTAAVQLRGGLAQGTYTVSWRAVSEDSHPVSGAFTFSIGTKSETAVPAGVSRQGGGSTAVGALYGTARAVAYGAFALLVGSAAFLLLCWPRGVSARPVQRLLMTGWGGLLLSTVAVVLLRGPYEKGSGLADAFDLTLVRATLDERLGTALAARLLLLAAAGVFLSLLVGQLGQDGEARREAPSAEKQADPADPEEAELRRLERRAAARPERDIRLGLGAAGLLLALALAATWAGADHAAVGIQAGLALPLDILHLVAMAVWLGGLVTLLVGLGIPRERGGVGAAAVGVFSRTAFCCVAVLVATGVYQSWRGLGSWSALVDTGYGRLLLIKVGFVGVMLGIAWFSRAWTARLLAAAPRAGAESKAEVAAAVVPDRSEQSATTDPGDLPKDPKRQAQLKRQRALRAAAAERRASADSLARERAAGNERPRLRRSVLAEAAVAVAVLAVTTLLTNSAPGRNAQTSAAPGVTAPAPAPAQPVSLAVSYDTGGSGPGAKGTAAISLDPARTGRNEMHVLLTDSTGAPVDVPELRIAFDLPAKNLGPLKATLQKVDTGHWSAEAQLPMAGDWQLSLTVRSSDIDEVTQTAPVRIG
ncbi:copper resistance protein CopC [Peterkaempfera bronchialis]|uniref:ABC transporter n=1 Tax=Peterkaempfera bronchialis TaxID=2126346 RepID=A0A345SYA0_9ACTN|nr:copper resistance protein CopC [Peterkaempfera bronchialis]AXI78705.1 ABC transporter [Peterkaempfera bronchialis]